jgi:hypothetical protein
MVISDYISGHNPKDNVRNINIWKFLDMYHTKERNQGHKILGMTISHDLLRYNAVCYLFLYGVFNYNVFISDHTMSNDTIIKAWWIGQNVGGNGHGITYYSSISLDRLREETRSIRQHSRYPAECRTFQHTSLSLPFKPTRLVTPCSFGDRYYSLKNTWLCRFQDASLVP